MESHDVLKDLFKTNLLASTVEHYITPPRKNDAPIKYLLYEPSRFIYAFFVFNSLYSIDWQNSTPKSLLEYRSNNREKDKIRMAVKFCLQDQQNRHSFFSKLENTLVMYRPIGNILDLISWDKNTGEYRASLVEFITHLIDLEDYSFDEENVLKSFYFIYGVRNNIFHGTKSMTDMSERNQRQRLTIYSTFLQAFNATLLEVASQKGFWHHPEETRFPYI